MGNWSDKNYRAFYFQRANAKRRRIGWELTFEQWLDIWTASGKLEQRGRGLGKYCMARFKDLGAYVEDNVEIIPSPMNNHDANFKRVRNECNRQNIADGIKTYWNDLSDEERGDRGRAVSEGQAASGAHEKAWSNPKRRKQTSDRMKQQWANLTVEQRLARSRAIIEGKRRGRNIFHVGTSDD